jgi:dihydrofolate reductase
MSAFLSAIYAVSENAVIGKENDLPWHLPNDLAFFKAQTLGKPILMGRKTYESIGRPLPKRRNLVLTRQPDVHPQGVEVYASLDDALATCASDPEVVLIGGAGLFKEAFDRRLVGRIYQTLVHAEVDGDVHFELPEASTWHVDWVEAHQADERHAFAYTFRILVPTPTHSRLQPE